MHHVALSYKHRHKLNVCLANGCIDYIYKTILKAALYLKALKYLLSHVYLLVHCKQLLFTKTVNFLFRDLKYKTVLDAIKCNLILQSKITTILLDYYLIDSACTPRFEKNT